MGALDDLLMTLFSAWKKMLSIWKKVNERIVSCSSLIEVTIVPDKMRFQPKSTVFNLITTLCAYVFQKYWENL